MSMENTEEPVKPNPYDSCLSLTRLTIDWITPFIFKAWWKPLQLSDMYDIPKQERAELMYNYLETAWNTTNKNSSFALLTSLHKSFGLSFWFSGFLFLISTILGLAAPIIMIYILQFLPDTTRKDYELYILVGALFLSDLLQLFFQNHAARLCEVVSLRVKSALTTKVYHKLLKLSSQARMHKSVGETINYLSIDTQKVAEMIQLFHYGWTGILTTVVCLGFLFWLLNWVAIVGVGAMFVMIPLQAILLGLFVNARTKTIDYSDARMKTVTEVMSNIKTIKFFAWEQPFTKKIKQLRFYELFERAKAAIIEAVLNAVLMDNPVLITCATFVVYSLLYPLNAANIFPAMTFFSIMRYALSFLPFVGTVTIEASVSMKRLQKFFSQEEALPVVEGKDFVYPVKINDATFIWEQSEVVVPNVGCFPKKQVLVEEELKESVLSKPGFLQNINLQIKHGDLCMIVGSVGSGKSTLLHALLGDLKKVSGDVTISGSIAYCAQQAWIQNSSFKQNVLFGLPEDEQRFR